ncbi:MAG: Maf family protein [Hyphomicrobiales bacterium]|nr:Maf family protein [Hyphomicrobiales bacterium]
MPAQLPTRIWLPPSHLILASKSTIRSTLLTNCQIPHDVRPADIDEREIESHANTTDNVALVLAKAKALAVSGANKGRYVLGADQTCSLDGIVIHKAPDIATLTLQLRQMRGRTHVLTSSAALALDSRIIGTCSSVARMTMRNFTDDFLENYLSLGGVELLQSVGGYQVEGLGITLMSGISGDFHTVMGLPLLELLTLFRKSDLLQQ